MQDCPAQSLVVVKITFLCGHRASLERFRHETWPRKKDVGLKKKHFQASARRIEC